MKNKLLTSLIFLFVLANKIYTQDTTIVSGKSDKKSFDPINGYYGGSTDQYRSRRADSKICENCLGAGDWDSIPLLLFKLNPLLMFGQKEFGFMIECHLRKYFSIEAGGGANINYTYLWEKSRTGMIYGAGEGFTLRTGMRFYSRSGIYFNPVFFYRHMTYHNRYYETCENNPFYSAQFEPGIDNLGTHSGDRPSIRSGDRGEENKQIFSFEALIGKEFRYGRMVVDVYGGLGVRNKYKQKKIMYNYYYGLYNTNISYYSPPKEEKIHGYLPTIHAGIQIGFISKAKK